MEADSPQIHVLGERLLIVLFQLSDRGRWGQGLHPGKRRGLHGFTHFLLGLSYTTDTKARLLWLYFFCTPHESQRGLKGAVMRPQTLKRLFSFHRLVPVLTVTAVRLGVLRSGRAQLGDSATVIRLLDNVSRRRRLFGERHDGGGGVGSRGHVVAVGEAVQVLAGGVDGAVDGTFGGAAHAVFLCLVQVVGDACV